MDDRTQERLEDLALQMAQAGVAFYDEALEALEQVAKVFSDAVSATVEAFSEAVSATFADVSEEFKRLFDGLAEDQARFHKKWPRVKSVMLPVLYLDKRRKVHRCRNTC